MADDDLRDFTAEKLEFSGRTHQVFRSGDGPAVLVLSEVPGITPAVAGFARRLRDVGLSVVMPDLFGLAGRDPNPPAHGALGTAWYEARTAVQLCVSREFTLLATGRSSPVVSWLRELGAYEHAQCGGPGIGVVGMCVTGGFALSMAVDDRVLAPVLSQPSLPVAVTPKRRASIDISDDDLEVVQWRCAAGLEVLGLRFSSDRFVPDERFAFLRRKLGDAFVAVELDDWAANPNALIPPHSVLTEHLVDDPGEPTRNALDTVLEHLRERLLG
ncbi:dienelactone hydrolase family protein [Dietzia sp.]|uniref:dienelactone hydrolase family protein n=1 Tax=Dietzia sp. TaxID=1871616 RepID=UPI002FDAB13A